MVLGFNLLGYASAEKAPVKRYNYLVAQIYPKDEPDPWKPLEPGVARAVGKLKDYLESSEHRIPKVSRRLARRLYKQVAKRRLGYARLTVDAYAAVLDVAGSARSYALSNELVGRSVVKAGTVATSCTCVAPGAPSRARSPAGSAVGLLLGDDDPGFRALGARLLSTFLDILESADVARDVDELVPTLAAEASSGGGRVIDTRCAEASLRALRADARFRARLALPSPRAARLAVAALRRLAREGGPAGPSGTNAEASAAPSVAADIVAEGLVRDLLNGPSGGAALAACLEHLDQDGRWVAPAAAAARAAAFPAAFGADESDSGLAPPAALHELGVLVRHVGAGGGAARPGESAAHGSGAGLTAPERAALLDGAARAAGRLPLELAPTALLATLRALDDDVEEELAPARVVAASEPGDTMRRAAEGTPATEAALRLVRALCRRAASAADILRAVTDALRAGGVGGGGAPGTGALARSALRAALRRDDPVPADRVDAALVGLADALRVLSSARRESAQRAAQHLLALPTEPAQLGPSSADALGASLALEASLPDSTSSSLEAASASLEAARSRLPPLAYERAAAIAHPAGTRRTGGGGGVPLPLRPAPQHAVTAAAAARAGARLPPESDPSGFSEVGSIATSTSPAEARATRLRALYRNLPADTSDTSLAFFLGGEVGRGGGCRRAAKSEVPAPRVEEVLATLRRATDVLTATAA